jgi:amino acid permease
MKQHKKPFKFYLTMFLIIAVAIFLYSMYKMIWEDAPLIEVASLWTLPFVFILIYYGSDVLMDKIFNKKKQINFEAEFIEKISVKMREKNEFLIEDYRRLKINQKFQESLKAAYKIFSEGEDDLFNISKLERKFKKGTIEYRAMEYVIEYLKENQKPIE